MQVLLDNNDTLMYSTHNEYKSVITERFIKTLKAKIYKTWQLMITNLILFIWINQYNNTFIILLIENLLILITLLWLKKLRQILKLLNLKLMINSELLSIGIFLVKVTLKIGQEKY